MIRGTTPTFILKLKNKDGTPSTIDLGEANNVYFTIAQGGKSITKTSEDIDIDGNIDVQYISEPIHVYKSSRIKGNRKVWYKLARQYARRNQNR